MSVLFAATHPHRTRSLVLHGDLPPPVAGARLSLGGERRGSPPAPRRARGRRLGVGDDEELACTAGPDHPARHRGAPWYTSYVQRGASPGANRAIRLDERRDRHSRSPADDQRADTGAPPRRRALPRTISIHGRAHPGRAAGRAAGRDHLPWEGDRDSLLDEIERFLTGARDDVEPDRVLATLLFTDIGDDAAGDGRPRLHRPARPLRPASCAPMWRAFAAARSVTAGDGWSRPSTARPAPSAAPRRSSHPLATSASRCEPASIPARSSDQTPDVRGIAVRHRRGHGRARPVRARCSYRARSRTSSPAPGSRSRSAASMPLRGFRAPGACSRRCLA